MSQKQILVLGGGFAGLWSAVGAARKLDELGRTSDVEITLVNRDAFHAIRVRNYEADLTSLRVALDDVLEPVGVRRVEGEVADIALERQEVVVDGADGRKMLHYDRLVFALGSKLVRPNIEGAEYAFDVDTFSGAERLKNHLESLAERPDSPGRFTVVVVGGGLTGIETAAEMPERLRGILERARIDKPVRVILADRNPWIGSDMGDSARPVIEMALTSLGVEMRPAIDVASISPEGIRLKTGEEIPAATVVWCAGMRASELTRLFPVERDRFGRLPVDEYLRVKGVPHVFAAGDVAWNMMDPEHTSIMSCQHGRPMGRYAGHNVVCDLLGLPMLTLEIPWYVTVLDLGAWGAVYTEGWERRVAVQGPAAKKTKQTINCVRIYPPLTKNRKEILDAAAPVVQAPPAVGGGK